MAMFDPDFASPMAIAFPIQMLPPEMNALRPSVLFVITIILNYQLQ
jgi:hypothetical protein